MVAVVQTAQAVGAGSPTTLNFGSNASIGNSVSAWLGDYNTSSSVISSSAPTYNGGSVSGATKLIEIQNGGPTPDRMYFAVWLLPNVQSSGTSVAISTTNANADGNSHYFIAEVAGLGASPAADAASPNPATASNAAGSTTPSSGATGSAVGSSGIVLGGMMNDGNNAGWTGPAGWTTITGSPNSYCGASYEIFSSSGASYTWSTTLASSGQWASGAFILDVTAAASVSGTVQPRSTVTPPRRPPSRAVIRSGPGTSVAAVPAPRQRPAMAVPPRRPPARAVVLFVPVTTVNAAPSPPPAAGPPPAIPGSGGDRTAALWEQMYTGRWKKAPGIGPVDPAAVPTSTDYQPRMTGRAFAPPPPPVVYSPPPEPPPEPAEPLTDQVIGSIKEAGAGLYEVGRILSTPMPPPKTGPCKSRKQVGLTILFCTRPAHQRGKHSDGNVYWD